MTPTTMSKLPAVSITVTRSLRYIRASTIVGSEKAPLSISNRAHIICVAVAGRNGAERGYVENADEDVVFPQSAISDCDLAPRRSHLAMNVIEAMQQGFGHRHSVNDAVFAAF